MFKGNSGLYKAEVGEAKIIMDEEKFVVAVPYRVTPKESLPHVRAYLNEKKETVVSVNFAPFRLRESFMSTPLVKPPAARQL